MQSQSPEANKPAAHSGQGEKPPRKKRFGAFVWALVCAGALLLGVLCNMFVVRLAVVHGPSMQPTLEDGEWVVVWQAGYVPQAGDIVVTDKNNPLGESLVKRVLATAGQRVEILPWHGMWVDGKWLDLPGLSLQNGQPEEAVDVLVPPDHLFLMGDNYAWSVDSREIGVVPVQSILGKVLFHPQH